MYPFKKGSFAPRNAWYVAAFSRDVGRHLVSRTFLNEPVVLFRKEDGTAVAVGGRCPHRHFPLGASCLTGDEIVCGYHGIRFAADGRCTAIPSQQHVPSTYRIPTYPLVEHGMWLWIWMGDVERADPALLPPLKEILYGVPGYVSRPCYFFEVKARYQLLNDNLCDLTHIAYLHSKGAGVAEHASTPEQTTKRPRYLRTYRSMPRTPVTDVLRKMGAEAEHVDRESGMEYYLPGFHAGFGDVTYSSDHPIEPGKVIIGGRVYHAITPSTPGSSYYWFGVTGISEAHVAVAADSLEAVVREDVFAAEEIEKMLQLTGEGTNELMIKTDRGAVEARRMLQRMMDEESVS